MEADQIQEWVREVSPDYIDDILSSSGSDEEGSVDGGLPVTIVKSRKTVKLKFLPDDEPIPRFIAFSAIMRPSYKKLAPIPHREESLSRIMSRAKKEVSRGSMREGPLPTGIEDTVRRVRRACNWSQIAPQPLKERFKDELDPEDTDYLDRLVYDANIWATAIDESASSEITWDLEHEFKVLGQIANRIGDCSIWDVSAATWNTRVWDPLLEIALAPFGRSVSHWDASEARVDKAYIPRTSDGETLEPHPPSFCITLDGKQIDDAVRYRLPYGTTGTINHTWYTPFQARPVAISIINTIGSVNEAEANLFLWTAGYFAKLRELSATSASANCAGITLPVIVINERAWTLYLGTDYEDKVRFQRLEKSLYANNEIVDAYRIVAVVRWLVVWSLTTFRDWLAEHALYTLHDEVILDDNAEDCEDEDEEMDDYQSD
ncbi:hypothetical protein ACHAPJ_013048 [Fusarium lateritium]